MTDSTEKNTARNKFLAGKKMLASLWQKVVAKMERFFMSRFFMSGVFWCVLVPLLLVGFVWWFNWEILKIIWAFKTTIESTAKLETGALEDYTDLKTYSDIFRNIILVLAAVIGLPFLIWRSLLAGQAQKTAQKNQEIAATNQRNALFENAIKHLESKNAEKLDTFAILGGIETLRQLAADNPDIEGKRVRTFLAHYLRLHYPYYPKSSDNAELSGEKWEIRREALRAFAGNFKAVDLQSTNLKGADLRGANLKGADLRGANL